MLQRKWSLGRTRANTLLDGSHWRHLLSWPQFRGRTLRRESLAKSWLYLTQQHSLSCYPSSTVLAFLSLLPATQNWHEQQQKRKKETGKQAISSVKIYFFSLAHTHTQMLTQRPSGASNLSLTGKVVEQLWKFQRLTVAKFQTFHCCFSHAASGICYFVINFPAIVSLPPFIEHEIYSQIDRHRSLKQIDYELYPHSHTPTCQN